MKEFIKKRGKLIIGLIIGLLLSVTIICFDKDVFKSLGIIKSNDYRDNTNLGDIASFASSDVKYNATSSKLTDFDGNTVTTVQDAIDSLYAQYGPCKSGYNKTDVTASGYICEDPLSIRPPYKCKRATTLHTETCGQSSNYCYADGYYSGGTENTTKITYGNLGTSGTLSTGDAFDCDVNGNGIVDTDANGNSTERFYYVSPRWTPGTSVENGTFDTSSDPIEVLIYYKDFVSGAPRNMGAGYYSNNYSGPVTAKLNLPTTTYWNNVTLVGGTTRAIIGCDNGDCTKLYTTAGKRGKDALPTAFSYNGYAARLLALPEFVKGCTSINGNVSSVTITGALKNCNFIFEGTVYANPSSLVIGPWFENPKGVGSSHINTDATVFFARPSARTVYYVDPSSVVSVNTSTTASYSVRPAIEVYRSAILY